MGCNSNLKKIKTGGVLGLQFDAQMVNLLLLEIIGQVGIACQRKSVVEEPGINEAAEFG